MSNADRRVIDSFADLAGTVAMAQLPPGIAALASTYAAENKDGATLAAGAPAAIHSSGNGIVAATASDRAYAAVGLLRAAADPGFAGDVQTGGALVLADWTAVTGAATLAARAVYYLDTAPGRLSAIPPSAGGQTLQRLGVAVSATTLELQVSRPILL